MLSCTVTFKERGQISIVPFVPEQSRAFILPVAL